MSLSSPAGEGLGVFISYRRSDCLPQANALYGMLIHKLPEARIFRDIDSIPAGVYFEDFIRDEIDRCDVALVLVGDNWLDAEPETGRRRIDDPDDFVRLEVESALLNPSVKVIPVLVEGARMPGRSDLPESIQNLARINALALDDARWMADIDQLVRLLEDIGSQARPKDDAPPVAAPASPAPNQPQGTPDDADEWNGRDWYVAFGEYVGGRSWADAAKYGFVSGGGGRFYSQTLRKVPVGARIFACIPKTGYVGVGTVTGPAQRFDKIEVVVDSTRQRLADLPLVGSYRHKGDFKHDNAEWVVPVDWEHTRNPQLAVWEKGMYANQNTATRLKHRFTLERLRDAFGLDD